MKRLKLWIAGFLIVFTVLLRIPTLFEPYWYGDEGIYLILGQMMQRGAILYRDIWDNKPPLLYLLYAIHPTLLWAKISATACVAGSVVGVFFLTGLVLKNKRGALVWSTLVATATSVLLSLPIFEGTIANAELYFTLPIILGAILVLKMVETRPTVGKLLLTGVLAFIAFLLKVPALFDFLAFGLFGLILIIESAKRRLFFKQVITRSTKIFVLPIAVFVGLLGLVILYFFLNNALGDFLTASFFQNASYVAVDTGPLAKLSNPLVTRGIVLLIFSAVVTIGYFRKIVSKELLFLSLWFGFSLYGALLSNRPYLHYLLQIIPPLVLMIVYIATNLRKSLWIFVTLIAISYYLITMFKGGFALEPRSYYKNWFDFISERKSFDDFANYFDSRTTNSYAIGNYIKSVTKPNDSIFVWGDAAFVYVLSERPAATKFIQAHHLTTIDRKNYDLVLAEVIRKNPKVIVIENPVHFSFEGLMKFLSKNYLKTQSFDKLDVYEIRRK